MRYYKNIREGNTIIHETFATKKKKEEKETRDSPKNDITTLQGEVLVS